MITAQSSPPTVASLQFYEGMSAKQMKQKTLSGRGSGCGGGSMNKPGAAVYVYIQLLSEPDYDYQSRLVRDSPLVGSTVQGRCEEPNVLHERAMTAISAPWCLLDHSGEVKNIEIARVACSGHDSLLAAHVKGINVCAVSVFGPYAHHLDRVVRRNLKLIFMRNIQRTQYRV